jgi:hypothetical protein
MSVKKDRASLIKTLHEAFNIPRKLAAQHVDALIRGEVKVGKKSVSKRKKA